MDQPYRVSNYSAFDQPFYESPWRKAAIAAGFDQEAVAEEIVDHVEAAFSQSNAFHLAVET